MSWIEGFPRKKRSVSKSPTKYSPIYLPTIDEIPEYDNAEAAEEVDISALVLQTPAKKRKMNPETPHTSYAEEIAQLPSPGHYQWTPMEQNEEDTTTANENHDTPEAGFDYDEITVDTLTSRGSPRPHSPAKDKEDRLFLWSCQGARDCDCCIDDFDKGKKAPSYEEFEEEEQRIRKKPRYAF